MKTDFKTLESNIRIALDDFAAAGFSFVRMTVFSKELKCGCILGVVCAEETRGMEYVRVAAQKLGVSFFEATEIEDGWMDRYRGIERSASKMKRLGYKLGKEYLPEKRP